MTPTAPFWTSPQVLRIEGTMPGPESLRLGDKIEVTYCGRTFLALVTEISVRDAAPRFVAEALNPSEGYS